MTVENTSRRDSLLHLAMMMGDSSSYIESMEAEGQTQLVNSDEMPVDAPWDELESLGFVKGDPVPGDELFCHASLPEGWKREGSDHSMWSYIVDDQGEKRVAVFYKAAFYDRRAHASIVRKDS